MDAALTAAHLDTTASVHLDAAPNLYVATHVDTHSITHLDAAPATAYMDAHSIAHTDVHTHTNAHGDTNAVKRFEITKPPR